MNRDLTRGPVTKSMLLFAIPMILGDLLQQCYNIADTLIVGQFLGRDALAAVGSSFTLMTFLTSIILGLCMGSGALLSMRFGQRDERALCENLCASFFFIALVTVLLNILSFVCLDGLRTFLRVPAEVWGDMREYLFVIFMGIPAVFLYNYFASFLRAIGNSVIPLGFLAVSAVLNIALDLWFVIGLNRGVAGTAEATVIAQYVSGIGIAAYAFMRFPQVRSVWELCCLRRGRIQEIVSFSTLTCVQQSIMNLGILMVQGLVNSFGPVVMAAFAAAVKIDAFAYMPVQDFGNAFSTYVAQNYGAGQTDRIRKGILQGLVMAAIIGVCSVGLGLLLTIDGAYLHIFLSADKVTADTIRFGNHFLYVDFSMYLLLCFLFVVRNCVQGIQRAPFVLWAGASELIARVAICLTLPALLSGGVVSAQSPELAFYALCAADPLACLAADLVLLVPFFKNMMHMNYQYLYGGVEQHLLGK